MTAKPITCRDSTWLVSDSRERPLTADEQASLHGHFETCSLCQGSSKQFEVLFRQLRRYFSGDFPEPSTGPQPGA